MNIEMINRIRSHPVLSVVLAGKLLAAMQPAMKAAGIDAFPVITLLGAPGTGKTAVVKSIAMSDGIFLPLTTPKKDIIKALRRASSENSPALTILDDFAKLSTDTGRRAQCSTIDTATRMGYSGETGMLVITMERAALSFLTESCRDRMLMVDIGDGVRDDDFSELVSFLQNTNDLAWLYREFCRFVQNLDVPYRHELSAYRSKTKGIPGYDPRAASLVFCYRKAMALLNDFILTQVNVPFDIEAVDQIAQSFFTQRQVSEGALAEVILHRLLTSGELEVQTCGLSDECSHHCKSGCKHRSSTCERGFCRADMYHTWYTSYSPTDLLLDYDGGFTALLLDDPTMIPNFHRSYPVPPLLLIDATELTMRMNSILREYARDTAIQTSYFTDEKLRKELFTLNRCIYIANGDGRRKYTFEHCKVVDQEVQNMRVIAILLREDEAKHLARTSRQNSLRRNSRMAYAVDTPHLIHLLKSVWIQFCIPVGEIGKASISP